MKLELVALEGRHVRLEPLGPQHFDASLEAALSDPAIFTYMSFAAYNRGDMERLFALAAHMHSTGAAIVFATRPAPDFRVAGSTSIRLVDANTPSVEIGGTWIVPTWQRTLVNTEAKYLQLRHCFETLGVARVELKTDIRNLRSQAAIRRLGATQEGIFRNHMRRRDGTLRDSVFFSIVSGEWPQVKARLEPMLTDRREEKT